MKKIIYEDPTIEIIELSYDADVIRTSITDHDEFSEFGDTYEEDPWGDEEDE